MRKLWKVIGLALLFATFLGVVTPGHAATSCNVFSFELKPTVHPRSAGPVDMAFSFAPMGRFCKDCDELRVTVITNHGLEFLGERNSWTVQADKEHPYSTILHVNVPQDDTCFLKVSMQCCHIKQTIGCYFVTIEDSIEYWTGNPRGYHPSPPQSKTNDPIIDTMTAEQLQTEYLIAVDLRDPDHLKYAEKLLGPLPDSCEQKGRKGTYITIMTMEQTYKLHQKGIDLDEVRTRETSPKRSLPAKPSKPDSIGNQGAIFPKGGERD